MPHYLAFVPVAETEEGEPLYVKRDLGDRGRIESAMDAAFDDPFVEKAELVKKNELAIFGVTREIKRLGDDGAPAPKKTRKAKAEEPADPDPPADPPADPEPAPDPDAEPDSPVRGFGRSEEE